jgi:hypothetical protein
MNLLFIKTHFDTLFNSNTQPNIIQKCVNRTGHPVMNLLGASKRKKKSVVLMDFSIIPKMTKH